MSVERDTFPRLARDGRALRNGRSTPTGSTPARPQAFLQANVDILNGRQGMHEFTEHRRLLVAPPARATSTRAPR